jgi:hypothetical protein
LTIIAAQERRYIVGADDDEMDIRGSCRADDLPGFRARCTAADAV